MTGTSGWPETQRPGNSEASTPVGDAESPKDATSTTAGVVDTSLSLAAEIQPAVRWYRFEENDPHLVFSSTWVSFTYQGMYTFKYTQSGNVRMKFEGMRIAFVALKGPENGMVTVWLDGTFVGRIDLYSSVVEVPPARVWTSPTLVEGPHILEIRHIAYHNPASKGYQVTFDAVEVLDGSLLDYPPEPALATP